MKNLFIYFIFLSLLSSCASWFDNRTYLQSRESFYSAYTSGNYQLALSEIDKNKILKSKLNKQLYLLEKGRLLQLNGDYKNSAKLLNDADELAEGWKNIRPIPASNGLSLPDFNSPYNQPGFSPMVIKLSSTKYRSEHYERMMMNLTKAISYINLGEKDATLVEAKRLLLLSQQLGDLKAVEYNYKSYVKDPFPELFAGLIFEWNGDYSNAFVSYENAYKCYIDNGTEQVYGVRIPEQLQTDLLRLSYSLGYNDKLEFYQSTFGKKYVNENKASELILLIEDGTIPSRTEDKKFYLFDTISKNSFDNTLQGKGNILFLPNYENHYQERNVIVNVNNRIVPAATLRNNNYIVMNTLNSRVQRERENLIQSFSYTLKSNYQNYLEKRKEQERAQANALQAAQKPLTPAPMPKPQEPKKENPTPSRPKSYNNNQINKQQFADKQLNKQTNIVQDNQNIQKPQSRYQYSDNNDATIPNNNLNYQSNSFISNSYANYNNYSNPISSEHVDVRNWLTISAKVSYVRVPLVTGIDNNVKISFGGKEMVLNIKGNDGMTVKHLRLGN